MMQTVNAFPNDNSVAFVFDPIHNKSIFVSMQLVRDLYVRNEVPSNQSVMGSATERKTLLSYQLLNLQKPLIL